MNQSVVITPRLSEKTYALSEKLNVYTFVVSKSANKYDVLQAVKKQYGVSPISVRLARVPGKPRRSVRQMGRSVKKFKNSDIIKAYVTLSEGDKLPIFAAIEADNKSKSKESK